ncbi:hypothetical protein DRN75_02250 [Nanoarchaeota archaeon]|nr:MAG: hypothetical protein DRN75_02250 [Nanoarchaeota archaeon]
MKELWDKEKEIYRKLEELQREREKLLQERRKIETKIGIFLEQLGDYFRAWVVDARAEEKGLLVRLGVYGDKDKLHLKKVAKELNLTLTVSSMNPSQGWSYFDTLIPWKTLTLLELLVLKH